MTGRAQSCCKALIIFQPSEWTKWVPNGNGIPLLPLVASTTHPSDVVPLRSAVWYARNPSRANGIYNSLDPLHNIQYLFWKRQPNKRVTLGNWSRSRLYRRPDRSRVGDGGCVRNDVEQIHHVCRTVGCVRWLTVLGSGIERAGIGSMGGQNSSQNANGNTSSQTHS